MTPLSLNNGALCIEAVPLQSIAQQFGTACYVYSRAVLEGAWNKFKSGIGVHIGSLITEMEPFVSALEKVLEFVDTLDATGITLQHLDMGGGLGIRYRDEEPPAVQDYLARLFSLLGERKVKVMFEPGRGPPRSSSMAPSPTWFVPRARRESFCLGADFAVDFTGSQAQATHRSSGGSPN